jgi:hypothetical protein
VEDNAGAAKSGRRILSAMCMLQWQAPQDMTAMDDLEQICRQLFDHKLYVDAV